MGDEGTRRLRYTLTMGGQDRWSRNSGLGMMSTGLGTIGQAISKRMISF